VADDIYRNHSVTLAHRVLLGTDEDMHQIAEAIERIVEEKDSLI